MRNTEAPWESFDPRAYEQANYYRFTPEDRVIAKALISLFREARAELWDGVMTAVDVGTGTNLLPVFAAYPWVDRHVLWEWSKANVEWLRERLATPLPLHWSQTYASMIAGETGYELQPSRFWPWDHNADVLHRSVFELPVSAYHVATMLFCAESITSDRAEFERAMQKFVGVVRPGGVFLSAHMAHSNGYTVGSTRFPAVSIDADTLRAVLEPLVETVTVTTVPIVEALRSGYSGMLLAQGRARAHRPVD